MHPPPLAVMDYVGPAFGALLFVGVMSLVEPTRRTLNAIILAGASGVPERRIRSVGTDLPGHRRVDGFRALQSYRWIAVGWLIHAGWDIVHHGQPMGSCRLRVRLHDLRQHDRRGSSPARRRSGARTPRCAPPVRVQPFDLVGAQLDAFGGGVLLDAAPGSSGCRHRPTVDACPGDRPALGDHERDELRNLAASWGTERNAAEGLHDDSLASLVIGSASADAGKRHGRLVSTNPARHAPRGSPSSDFLRQCLV
jgi:hypothetical protein